MSENVKNSGETLVDAKKADESENDKKSESKVVQNDASDDEKEKDSKTTTNESKSKSENDDANISDKKQNKNSESAKGIALGAIPQIEKYIYSTRIEGLQTLHQICFQAIGKTNVLKKNLRQFSGFEFDENSDEFEERVESAQKMELAKLKAVCEGLRLDKKGTKDVICQRICKFLIAPQKTDDTASDEEASDSEEGEEEEEEESEPEPEPVRRTKSSGRANAGRPRRSTAGRGKDTSTYVEYSSSSDEDEKSNRSKSNKRKKDDSDSGSDYNPEPDSAESDTGKKGTRFSTRAQPASRRSTRNRRSTSEEEETPTSDEDFSDEPKKRKVTPRGGKSHGRTRGRGRGRKAKDTESEEDQSESESDQSEETPKRKSSTKNDISKRNTTPRSKRAAASAKPIRDESSGENESEDDEPLSKKAKPSPPTDEEIKKIVKDILDKANLEEITMKTVCRHVYSKYPEFDLSHKKEFIKTTVKSLIST